MRKNHTLDLIRRGELAAGLWLSLGSIHSTRLLAAQGCCDWLLVDLEHSPVDIATAAVQLASIADITQGQTTPLARVARGTMDQIKHVLDAGAQGIIVPMVESAEDAANVVRYARFPPEGERGAGGLLPHLSFATHRGDYMQNANRDILVGIQIETKTAVDNLDAILDVPGLDLIFIGPNDLHLSLGLVPRYWSDEPAYLKAVDQVAAGCRARNLPLGTLCLSAEAVQARRADGYTFLGMGSDAGYLLGAVGAEYGKIFDQEPPPEGWAGGVRPVK